MKKTVSFKKGENLVTINFNSNGYFSLSADIYKVATMSEDELFNNMIEYIESNIHDFIDDLMDNSINELIDSEIDDIMRGYDDYCGVETLYSEAKDDNLIQVEYVEGGQIYNELLNLLPESEPIKELTSLWSTYQLKKGTNQPVINKVNDLLNQLDSGKDEVDLAETMVKDYIKENY